MIVAGRWLLVVTAVAWPLGSNCQELAVQLLGKDGAPMALVRAGEFTMGGPSGVLANYPIHKVHVDDFYMDQYEVTVSLYSKFLTATNRQEPGFWYTIMDAARDGKLPAFGMTWFDAEAYCKWAGKRLPTEAEWEKAGRGADGRLWPWGNDIPQRGWANFNPYPHNDSVPSQFRDSLAPGGSYRKDRSPYGIYDLAGNVSEWVSDWHAYDYYEISPYRNPKGPASGTNKVIRGGNLEHVVLFTLAYRFDLWPSGSGRDIGFRCAMDVPG